MLQVSRLGSEHDDLMDTFLQGLANEAFEQRERQLAAREILESVMAQMRPEDRTVLTLIHLEGYSLKEGAELLGWSVSNTKVRAFRARKAFRRLAEKLLREKLED